MNEAQKTTDFLFTKMKKLYPTFERPDELDVSVWVDILDGYSQTEILEGLKNYRKNVPYNVAPLPAKFKEYLPEKHTKTATPNETKELPTGYFYWKQDGESGDLKYYLQDYERAFDLCINDYLKQVVPIDVVERSSWVRKIKLAMENGVLNRMSEALQEVCPTPRFMSDNEFYSLPENANKRRYEMTSGDAVKTLSAHWRAA